MKDQESLPRNLIKNEEQTSAQRKKVAEHLTPVKKYTDAVIRNLARKGWGRFGYRTTFRQNDEVFQLDGQAVLFNSEFRPFDNSLLASWTVERTIDQYKPYWKKIEYYVVSLRLNEQGLPYFYSPVGNTTDTSEEQLRRLATKYSIKSPTQEMIDHIGGVE